MNNLHEIAFKALRREMPVNSFAFFRRVDLFRKVRFIWIKLTWSLWGPHSVPITPTERNRRKNKLKEKKEKVANS